MDEDDVMYQVMSKGSSQSEEYWDWVADECVYEEDCGDIIKDAQETDNSFGDKTDYKIVKIVTKKIDHKVFLWPRECK